MNGPGSTSSLERERGEAEAGRPALGSRVELFDLLGREIQRREQLAALLEGEREVGGPNLRQVAVQPLSMQP